MAHKKNGNTTQKSGNTTQKSGNTTQKKITIFLSFLQKLREWHTKTKNYWDSVEISCKHTKKHIKKHTKTFYDEYEYYIKRKTFFLKNTTLVSIL